MAGILEKIDQPSDLKALSYDQLPQLAREVRDLLISTVTNNGGHLASSLGVVELTIALHRVFSTPNDKIIWDVGHQSYAHKLFTGRRKLFHTLRQYGGLSGFPDSAESEHDAFTTGHASTSISSATGMAAARDLAGKDYHIVAVIGDGALSGGIALEALNQVGTSGTRLIVVLNDNGMTISPSTGAISRWLNRVRLDQRYHRAKEEAKAMAQRLPLGKRMLRLAARAKDGLKMLIVPTMFFGELGFNYMGPYDGHNILELEAALKQAAVYKKRPILIHVLTQKGKGYGPAEEDAIGFHGIPPNGVKKPIACSYSEILGKTLIKLFQSNEKLVAITAAMPEGTGLNLVANLYPKRVFDVGICEQHAVTFAAGLASQGYVPVVAIYSTFLQRAFDQIIHDVCLQGMPVVFAIDRSGIVGEDGKTHQGNFDLSYLNCAPGMTICAPKDENEFQHLIYTAVKAGRPVAIRYPRGAAVGVPLDTDLSEIGLGEWEVLRSGRDVYILAVGVAVMPALEVAERLNKMGVDCGVVNARFIKPLDTSLLRKVVQQTKKIVTVEENSIIGGFGSSVQMFYQAEGQYDVNIKCIALPDSFIEQGPQQMLRSKYGLDSDGIFDSVVKMLPSYNLKS